MLRISRTKKSLVFVEKAINEKQKEQTRPYDDSPLEGKITANHCHNNCFQLIDLAQGNENESIVNYQL